LRNIVGNHDVEEMEGGGSTKRGDEINLTAVHCEDNTE